MHERARQLLEEFFRHLGDERRLSPHTLVHYRRDLDRCVAYCDGAGVAGWDKLATAEVRGWVAALHRHGLSGKSIQRALSALRTFYRYLLREQAASLNPPAGVPARLCSPRPASSSSPRARASRGVAPEPKAATSMFSRTESVVMRLKNW